MILSLFLNLKEFLHNYEQRTCTNSKVIVGNGFNATMQIDPIKLQEKTVAVVVVVLMGLCLCAEAGSE